MSDHILELLGAYMDGEVKNRDIQKVEQHLDECLSCQDEYASLQTLSLALHEAPLPDFPSAKHFAADVALRLPRKAEVPISSKVLEIGWWAAPLGLLSAWIFIITTNLISELLSAANIFGLVESLETGTSSQANWSATLGNFGLLSGSNLQWAEMLEAFTRSTAPQIAFQVAIAILYLSWMAIWWARHTGQPVGQALEN